MNWRVLSFSKAVACAIALSFVAQSSQAQLNNLATIDAQVDSALVYLLESSPKSEDLMARSAGVLVIPVMTKAGLFVGGAYGEGALRVNGETVDFYSALQVSYGLQAGAKQYSQALFFMNQAALEEFRGSKGWTFGAQLEAVSFRAGEFHSVESLDHKVDVVGIVFGQAGLQLGTSLSGTKYSRLAR